MPARSIDVIGAASLLPRDQVESGVDRAKTLSLRTGGEEGHVRQLFSQAPEQGQETEPSWPKAVSGPETPATKTTGARILENSSGSR